MARLIRPSLDYAESYAAAIHEYQAEGTAKEFNFQQVELEIQKLLLKGEMAEAPRVLESVFWLVEDDRYIGDFKLRHELNDFLKTFGGHIGYQVRPSERRKGYGKLGLRLLLDEARKLNLARVMITCDVDNIASRRIIEMNGGILEEERRVDWHPKPYVVWWISLES